MAVENVACPYCGKEALTTVAMGHYIVGVNRFNGLHPLHNADNSSECFCAHCVRNFYSYSIKA